MTTFVLLVWLTIGVCNVAAMWVFPRAVRGGR